jgi:hypothetical protein
MNQRPSQPYGWIVPDLVLRAQAGEEAARQELLTQSALIIQRAIFRAFSAHPPRDNLEDLQHDIYTGLWPF